MLQTNETPITPEPRGWLRRNITPVVGAVAITLAFVGGVLEQDLTTPHIATAKSINKDINGDSHVARRAVVAYGYNLPLDEQLRPKPEIIAIANPIILGKNKYGLCDIDQETGHVTLEEINTDTPLTPLLNGLHSKANAHVITADIALMFTTWPSANGQQPRYYSVTMGDVPGDTEAVMDPITNKPGSVTGDPKYALNAQLNELSASRVCAPGYTGK